MEGETTLPVIDLKKAQDPDERQRLGEELVKSLETVGFLYVDNAPGVDFQALYHNCEKFFSLSQAEKWKVTKQTWNKSASNQYRGYFPAEPGDSSYKEGFEVGLGQFTSSDADVLPLFHEGNTWPEFQEGREEFKLQMESYYQALLETGTEILRLLALGSGLDESWFESMFLPDTLSTLRLLHYPPRPGQPPRLAYEGDQVVCCGEHSDGGFVTLLATFHFPGLQIRNSDNEWMDVVPRPNSLVMNIGSILSKLSNGRFKATKHRVVDTMQDRFSVPFFFEPRYSAVINRPIPFKKDKMSDVTSFEGSSYGEIKYGPWVARRMKRYVEYKELFAAIP